MRVWTDILEYEDAFNPGIHIEHINVASEKPSSTAAQNTFGSPPTINTQPVENRSKTPARRKTIDRRDEDSNEGSRMPERRSQKDRRTHQSADEKPETKAPEISEAEKQRQRERERNEMRIQQHRKKKLLAGCEPVMGLNYDCLAMDDYPENALVVAAKRDRDYWIFLTSVFATVFLLGLMNLLPAWIAASAGGLSLASALFAFSPARKHFFSRPPLRELLNQRKKIEFRALNHIHFLEGDDGLAWRCAKMAKYNRNLDRKLFTGLIQFSHQGRLAEVLRARKHIRLYLLFMIEAQKAYKRLQNDYLSNHFKNLDQGWDDNIEDSEAHRLETERERFKGHEERSES